MGIHLPRLSVLYHITVDPKFGLAVAVTHSVLAPVGYLITLKQRAHRAEVVLSSLYSVAAMLVMNAGYYLWWGGYAFWPPTPHTGAVVLHRSFGVAARKY